MTDFVSAEWVADQSERLRVVDVRDAWEYDGLGHLPGAVNVPFDSFRAAEHGAESGAGDGMLPAISDWEALLSEAGISRESDVLAYDDHHGVFAARFLVTAELFGHDPDRLHLLDGDFSSWQLERETSDETPSVEATTYEVTRPDSTPLVDADAVAEAIDDPDAVLVDTRQDEEFEAGHIPGAVLLDWRTLVDDETRGLLPEDEARAILESAGIRPEKRIVLYCNTARRISHTYIVLRHLGYEHIDFYEGSLTEWEATDRPIETE